MVGDYHSPNTTTLAVHRTKRAGAMCVTIVTIVTIAKPPRYTDVNPAFVAASACRVEDVLVWNSSRDIPPLNQAVCKALPDKIQLFLATSLAQCCPSPPYSLL